MLSQVILLGAALTIPGVGTQGRAMGGTGVALAADPTAIWYNPAGLADLSGTSLLIDAAGITFQPTFQRAGMDPESDQAYPLVQSKTPTQFVPLLVGTWSPIPGKLTLAMGFQPPAGMGTHIYPADGPQRYSLIEVHRSQVNYGFWAGYKLHRWVSIGAGLGGVLFETDQEFAATAFPGPGLSESPEFDIPVTLEAHQDFIPILTGGLQVTPPSLPGFSLGASYRPSINIDAPGILNFAGIEEKIKLHSSLPSITRLGAAYKTQKYTAALDFVLEDWGKHDSVTLDILDGQLLGDERSSISLDRSYKPGYSLRLGGSREISKNISLLAGSFYETNSIPDETLDVGSIDSEKIGASLGGAYSFSRYRLSLALSHVALMEREVTNSQSVQTVGFDTTEPTVLGNGTYNGTYNVVSMSLYTQW